MSWVQVHCLNLLVAFREEKEEEKFEGQLQCVTWSSRLKIICMDSDSVCLGGSREHDFQ